MIEKLLDKTFGKFLMVGMVNTLFGTAIMFVFYNCFHFGYWLSSASNYIFGSILSYFLNKYFTFRSPMKGPIIFIKFMVNISACYLISYGIAKPLIRQIFYSGGQIVQENVAMLVGMCLFVGLNYIGQRFWVFKRVDTVE